MQKRQGLHYRGWLQILCYFAGLATLSVALLNAAPLDKANLTALGWQHDASDSCDGYFLDQPLLISTIDQKPLTQGKARITGDSIQYSNEAPSVLEHVMIEEPGKRVFADRAWLIRDAKTHQITTIHAIGHVKIFEAGKAVLANETWLHLAPHSADIQDIHYRVALTALNPTTTATTVKGLIAQGTAARAKQLSSEQYNLQNLTYTTCSPLAPTWQVSAQDLDLNQQTGRGVLKHGKLYLGKLPIAYFPYWNFPIDKRRQSGFLTPRYSYSSVNGFGIILPYYLNLAPNLDDEIMPLYYSKRGLLMMNRTRYLTTHSSGSLLIAGIQHDAIFGAFKDSAAQAYRNINPATLNDLLGSSLTRRMLSWQQHTQWNSALTTDFDYNHTSDDYFQQDFTLPVTSGNLTNQLLQKVTVNYTTPYWQLEQTIQQYQTLHPINLATTLDQYRELPEISFHSDSADKLPGVELTLDAQAVHFIHDSETTVDPFSNLPYADGDRYHVSPELSIPYYRLGGYVVPSVAFDATQYELVSSSLLNYAPAGQNMTRPGMTISRSIPIFDIDSGLTFTRHLKIFDHTYLQTLEPRLFYLYVPYEDQSTIPLFDTMAPVFSYQQLFTTNRFIGFDRIGDANQLAAGVTSRFLQDNGGELFHVSAGQITYFQPRLVTLCSTPGCITTENPTYQSATSDVAGEISASIAPHDSLAASVAWNPTRHDWDNRSLTYTHQSPLFLQLVYSDQKTLGLDATTPTVSSRVQILNLNSSIPLSDHWSLLGAGSAQIELAHDNAKAYYFGIEYDTCCLALQMLGGRNFIGYDPNNHSEYDHRVYLQLILKGMGAVGSLPTGNGIADVSGSLLNNRTSI